MKKTMIFFSLFLLSLLIFPKVASAENGRRLDEVLGEFGYSIVGDIGDNMVDLKEKERYLGQKLIEGYKGRINDLNDIFNGALSFEGGDTGSQTWDKIVDFVFPVEKEKVEIKATPDLKKTLANIIINMPEKVDLNTDGYKYLGNFSDTLSHGGKLGVPFNYTYVEGTNSKFIEFRVINKSQLSLDSFEPMYFMSEKFVNVSKDEDVYVYEKGISAHTLNFNFSPDKVDYSIDLTNHNNREFNYLIIPYEIPLLPLRTKYNVSVDVYYSLGSQLSLIREI